MQLDERCGSFWEHHHAECELLRAGEPRLDLVAQYVEVTN